MVTIPRLDPPKTKVTLIGVRPPHMATHRICSPEACTKLIFAVLLVMDLVLSQNRLLVLRRMSPPLDLRHRPEMILNVEVKIMRHTPVAIIFATKNAKNMVASKSTSAGEHQNTLSADAKTI
jgi:hypothetical protein